MTKKLITHVGSKSSGFRGVAHAATANEHKEILKLAKLSEFTKGFADVRFIQEYYSKEWVGIAVLDGAMVGFICIRHCVRSPWTTIYYVGSRVTGAGALLVGWAAETSPHQELRCGVDERNTRAYAFWQKLGFRPTGHDTFDKKRSRIIQLAAVKP